MPIEKTYPSRYDYGVKTIKHKGVEITTSINTDIEQILDKIPNDISYQVGHCTSIIVHRPDLISNIFFNTPSLWWYIQLFNNINDPFEGFNPGDRLLIPSADLLETL